MGEQGKGAGPRAARQTAHVPFIPTRLRSLGAGRPFLQVRPSRPSPRVRPAWRGCGQTSPLTHDLSSHGGKAGVTWGAERELVHFFTHSFVGAADSMLPAPRNSRPLTSHRQCQAECHLGPGLGEGGEGVGPARDVTSESILVSRERKGQVWFKGKAEPRLRH